MPKKIGVLHVIIAVFFLVLRWFLVLDYPAL